MCLIHHVSKCSGTPHPILFDWSLFEIISFSPLRFIPKSSTVRPITNMRHCPTSKGPVSSQKPQSINRRLQNLFEVLKFEKERNPKSLGATLFGSDDLYRVLKPFAEKTPKCVEGRPLYFVHVDVSHCYESIPHQKLFDIMNEVIEEEEYLIRRFALLKMSSGKVFRYGFNLGYFFGQSSVCKPVLIKTTTTFCGLNKFHTLFQTGAYSFFSFQHI